MDSRKKARLLAVVGLHSNTLNPIPAPRLQYCLSRNIRRNNSKKSPKCNRQWPGPVFPDFKADLRTLLATYKDVGDVPDYAIPEAIADLMAETFSEPKFRQRQK